MIPYIIFLIIILLFYYKKNPIGILATIIVFAALRYNTGWDYVNYIDTVNTPREWNNPTKSRFSLLWTYIFMFSYNIHFPHFAIAITNIVTYIIIYHALKLLKLNRTRISQALIVYTLWYSLYLSSFSVIRQSISIGLGLLIFAYIQRQSYLKSILSLILAVHLHTSAIVLLLLYPIYYLRKKLNTKFILICAIISTLGILNLVRIMKSIPMLDEYLLYLGWKDSFGGLMVYIDFIFLAYLLLALYRIRNISIIEIQCFFISIMAFLGRLAIYFSGLSTTISRVLDYFIIFIIIILLPSLKIFKDKNTITNIAVSLLSLYFLVYLLISQGGVKLASSGYVPYKFIIFN